MSEGKEPVELPESAAATEGQREVGASPDVQPTYPSKIPGHAIFIGPQGLRAGWSLLLFALLFVVLLFVGGFLAGAFVRFNTGGAMPPRSGLLMELSQLIPALVATGLMAALERRPLTYYGFQGSARGVRFVSGIGWGFVAISALVFMLRLLGYLSNEGRQLGGWASLKYGAAWGVVFLLTGFFEESAFRGYIQFTITRGLGFWWGMILFAALFGLMHKSNPGESSLGLASVVGVGLIFCLSLWYTGSLWWAVGFHAAWDWGQSYFYGTADSGLVAQGSLIHQHAVGSAMWSGGATGPEGSILVFPILLIVALGMVFWWGRREKSPFAGAAWRPLRMRTPRGF